MFISKPLVYASFALMLVVLGRDLRSLSLRGGDDWMFLLTDADGPYFFKYVFAAAFFIVGMIHRQRGQPPQ